MLDKYRYLGVSKRSFLENYVVPANDNDIFNDNRCVFCWEAYEGDHYGARVLPCNHVFGHNCLTKVVNIPTGDLCALCQTKLFRPPLPVLSVRIVNKLTGDMFAAYFEYWDMLPTWLRSLIWFYIWRYNVFQYIDLLLHYCTNIQTRNPNFAINYHPFFTGLCAQSILRLFAPHWPGLRVLGKESWICAAMLSTIYRRLNDRWDRIVFASMAMLGTLICWSVQRYW